MLVAIAGETNTLDHGLAERERVLAEAIAIFQCRVTPAIASVSST